MKLNSERSARRQCSNSRERLLTKGETLVIEEKVELSELVTDVRGSGKRR